MDFDRLREKTFSFLENHLDENLMYHTPEHTKEILDNTVTLANAEKVDGKNLTILKTAALLHDIGYAKSNIEHEAVSCDIASRWLPGFGYKAEDIQQIKEIIMSTRIPQNPKGKLSEILCDADLYYLGGNEYESKAGLLFSEMKKLKTIKNEKQWLRLQIDFLISHTFFTQTAQKNRNSGKQNNLNKLLAKQKSIQNEQTL